MSRAEAERERVVGLAAAYAVMRARPADVLAIAHAASARRDLRELLREAARRRIAYREVEPEELARIADTVHHEGVCLSVRPRPRAQIADLARALASGGVLLALDHVENPHNVGALLRSAAYFGARGLLLASPRERALTPAAVRIAEGGAECVPTCIVPGLGAPLAALRAEGISIIGADAHRGEPATRFRFPARVVIVLGSERHGLAREVEQRCDALVHIPGTDAVESLNVSVAAGILLALCTARAARLADASGRERRSRAKASAREREAHAPHARPQDARDGRPQAPRTPDHARDGRPQAPRTPDHARDGRPQAPRTPDHARDGRPQTPRTPDHARERASSRRGARAS